MQLFPYLNFGGNCQQAFEFYAAHLGGRIVSLSLHGEFPGGSQIPDWGDKVLHARLELGGTMVFGADIPSPPFQPIRSAYLSLLLDSNAEAERVYALLTEGGEIYMAMAETFFAHRFAMLRDRFGTSWMLLHERAGQ